MLPAQFNKNQTTIVPKLNDIINDWNSFKPITRLFKMVMTASDSETPEYGTRYVNHHSFLNLQLAQ
jgi:hypothetical protein